MDNAADAVVRTTRAGEVLMETLSYDLLELGEFTPERPSEDFLRAVSRLLETDPDDLLAEMGYVPNEAIAEEMLVSSV